MKEVLIIESDTWLGDHFEDIVQSGEFIVSRAANSYSAMDMITDKVPAVILMNLKLSSVNGIGLLHELQTYSDTAGVPIIVYADEEGIELETLEPYGVKRVLIGATMKPADVVAAVRGVLA